MADFQSSRTAKQIESTLIGAVQFNERQTLTEAEKARARENIGAGTSNNSMTILGYYDTPADLETGVINPAPGAVYGVGKSAPYDIYIWDALNKVWKNNGNIKGVDGTNGSDAKVTAGAVVGALGFTPEAQTTFFVNTYVSAASFIEQGDSESEYFPFKASIPLAGVTANHFIDVCFAFKEQESGNFSQIADSFDGGIYLYAGELPEDDFIIPTIHATKMTEKVEGGLPNGYLPIEYAESTGAYINTGFKPTNKTRLWGKFNIEHPSEGFTQVIGNSDMCFAYGASADAKVDFGVNGITPTVGLQEMPLVLDFNGANFRLGTYETELAAAEFNSDIPLFLFAKNNGNDVDEARAKTSVYYLNIYEDGVIQRQYIPCYRLSDLSVGLYDLVTQLFYAPTVGTLTPGEAV